MNELITFILDNLVGKESYDLEETQEDEERVVFEVRADKDVMGLIIGKGGRTIKSIQDVLRVKARLEDKHVYINVEERE